MKLQTKIKYIPETLEDIFAHDELGLLADVQPAVKKIVSSNDPAINNFLELLEFVNKNGREPSSSGDITEKKLAARLKTYRTQKELSDKVRDYDTIGLLNYSDTAHTEKKIFNSLEDIFAHDTLGLLDDVESSIYQLKHIAKTNERDVPDEIAIQKPCKDFFKFEKLFQDIHSALRNKIVTAVRFRQENSVKIESVFILRGLLCYVESMIKDDNTGDGKYNPRYRVIFENGTETDLLKHSLIRALFKDPQAKFVDFRNQLMSDVSLETITSKDRITGHIYILASKSIAPALAPYINTGRLIKIGYTTQKIEERIKNAENDPTYLEAPVEIIDVLNCYKNLDPHKFEQTIHTFLSEQRLMLKLISKTGKIYHPKEWFIVNYETALAVCKHIADGTIAQYRMDNVSGKIVKKK